MRVMRHLLRKPLSLSKKCEIFRSLKKGISIASLSRRFNLPKSVISKVKKGSGRMVHFVRKIEFLRRTNTPKTELALQKWIRSQKKTNATITTISLYKQAQRIHDELMESPDFNTSIMWVDCFKRRHKIRTYKMKPAQLAKKTKKPSDPPDDSYLPDQIYRADEMVLFWRVLPAKSIEHTPLEDKSPDECLTFLSCTNVNGTHKLKPLIVSTMSDPDIVNTFDSAVHYQSSMDSRMTKEIFNDWFHRCFVNEISQNLQDKQLPVRAILLLDSSICHHPPAKKLTTRGGNIKTMLIPSAKVVNRNVADIARFEYKRRLLTDVLANSDKPITLHDAITNLRLSWDNIPTTAVESCWKKIMHDDELYTVEDYTPLSEILAEIEDEKQNHREMRELVNCLEGGEEIDNDEVMSWLLCDNGVSISTEDPIDDEEAQLRHERALFCLETLMGWARESQNQTGEAIIKIHDIIDLTLTNDLLQPQPCTSQYFTIQD